MKWPRRRPGPAREAARPVCNAHEPVVDFDDGKTLSVSCRRCGQRLLAPVDRILTDPREDDEQSRYSLN